MRTRPNLLLLAGTALIVLANTRWNIGWLAWIAPLPLLRYLRLTSGWRSRVALAAAVIAGWGAAVAKIATAPMPLVMGVVFGVIIGAFFALGYLAWDLARRRVAPGAAVAAFPAAMVCAEWLQSRLTDLGGWGAAAFTQFDDPALLQVAAVFGTAGVGFLVYWVAAALEQLTAGDPPDARRVLAPVAAAVTLAHVAGALRLAMPLPPGTMVAAVVTDAAFGPGPLPAAPELARINDSLFARTARAARAGARLVSWTEVATATEPADEPALLARARQAAREERIELVIGYAVPRPLPGQPVRYENKAVWIHPDGAIAQVYRKHHPVPGEPAIRGTEPLEAVVTSLGRAAMAVCYDFDFPTLTRGDARLGVGLVVVPSSDWLGIDPLHTRMASLRAIEGGHAVLRSTRMGLSAGIDPMGRLRGMLSSFQSADRVLLVTLPTAPVAAPYRVIGDLLVYLAFAGLLATLVRRRLI